MSPCKTKKTQSRNPPVVAEDRISYLPEELILQILSLLPTETTIKTSILSKKWKNQWKKIENLRFDSKEHKSKFTEHVSNALLTYQNLAFQSLTIGVWKRCHTTDLAIWIRIALAKYVSKLVLRLNKVGAPVLFPDKILQHTNRLRILKLMGNMLLNLSLNSVALDCLKELHLYNIKFDNEESVTNLLKGCPALEDLILEIFIKSGVQTLNIIIPSLKKLIFKSYFCAKENLVIQTPSLTYLDMQRFDGIQSCVIEQPPELAAAKILNVTSYTDEDILGSITSVQQLTLCSSIKFPVSKNFWRLKTLELNTLTDIWCNLLSFMLSVSPNVETLKLVGGMHGRLSAKWIQPQCVANSLLNHLHTLHWEGFIYDGKDDKDVAIYILENAAQLTKATFTTLNPPTPTLYKQREETLNQLSRVIRASPECHLVLRKSKSWTEGPSFDIDPDAKGFHY